MNDEVSALEARVGFLIPLNKLPPERQNRLLEQSEVIKLRKKHTLFRQGERDDFTYYLIDGEIEMYADDSLIKRVTGGDGASFQPLAQLQPRQMSAIAKTNSEILRVKRSLLDQLLSMDEPAAEDPAAPGMEVEEMESDQGGDWLMTLLQSELFTRIPPSNIQGLLDTLETVSLNAGDTVISQGEAGDYYYAIQSGACEVVRSGANKREIKLADLKTGDTFGEEALISGAKRNATVRMTRAGELARLTKEDFTRLIKAPLLDSLSREAAEQKVAAGARWLDVRFEDEHAHNGISGSLNIPHGTLRTRMDELDPDCAYIAYCDTGGRSSAAAFLLAEKGFDVAYVEGGAVTEQIPAAGAPAAPASKPPSKTKSKAASGARNAPKTQAKAKTSAEPAPAARAEPPPARADFANDSSANAAAGAAQTPPTDAPSSRDAVIEANALVLSLSAEAEKAQLTIDKARAMMAEAEAMKREAERVVAEKLASERERMDAETNKLKQRLEEAERLKKNLSEQQAAAEAEATRRQNEVEERVQALEVQTRERLSAEEQRLEALYQKQTDQLETLQADRETELREKLSAELNTERKKFEQEVLRTNEELERAQQERREAIVAKEAAAAEAEATIAEFKAQQQAIQAEQQKALETERKRLQAEAARIEKIRDEATRAREAAEAARRQAQRDLHEAQALQAADVPTADERALVEIAQRASTAEDELQAAIKAESVVNTAARENEDELERTYDTATEINQLLARELNEFVGEQDELLESTLQREVLSRQKEMVERIKARAAQMQIDSESRNQSLLDEIAQQLRKN